MNYKIVVLIVVISVLSLSEFAYADTILDKTLTNGMQIAVKENHNNNSIGFYCFVKTGSVNEGEYLGAGISHYLEHVVAGGSTTYHTEAEYEAMAKEMGAIVNAYTTSNATAFYITVDKQYANQALEILFQQMHACAFDSVEVAREKQVILKEIVMRSTPPRSKVYQRNNELVFPTSNRKYPVIGYTELFKTITRDKLADYYHKRYVPNNMIFVAAGDFDAEDMLQKIEDIFNELERGQLDPVYLPPQNPRSGTIQYMEEFQIQQPTVAITSILSSADFDQYPALIAALDILFGKRQSPIKYKLVEELQLVNYIYARVSVSMDMPEGVISIGFEAKDPEQIDEIISIIDEEIEWYSIVGIEEADIQNLITRYKASQLLSTPGVDHDCNNIGWNLMMFGVTDSDELFINAFEQLTTKDVMNSIKEFLVPKNRVIFYALPEGTKQLLDSTEELLAETSTPQKVQVNDNLTLIYKQNTLKPIISGVLYLPIGDTYETVETVGTLSFMENLMLKGSEKYNSLDLTEWKEDHAIDLDVRINDDGTYIEFKCLNDDFSKLQDIIIDAMNHPTFPAHEIMLAQQNAMARYQRSLSNASSIHNEFRSEKLYPGQSAGVSNLKKLELKQALDQQNLMTMHKKFFKAESAIVTLFGDLTMHEAETYAKRFYSNFPQGNIDEPKNPLVVPNIEETFVQEYDFEPVNIDLNCIAPARNIETKDYWTMRAILAVLNGSRGRIHKAVRGQNDLAYYGYAQYSTGQDYGFFRITSQTSIDKKDELIAVLNNQIELLKNEKVSQDELQAAIDDNIKMIKTDIDDNQLPFYMTHYEAIGFGYDYLDHLKENLSKITPEDIQQAANTYFGKVAVFVSEPNADVDLMVQ
ncbi:MAG: insulinase family protein [Candidatus Cloacimonetes bacterium]|nr:insulinase family protein [Candidatus Cloacimonadota bacterium]